MVIGAYRRAAKGGRSQHAEDPRIPLFRGETMQPGIEGDPNGGTPAYSSQPCQIPAAWNMIASAISRMPMPRLSRMAKTSGS